MITKSRLFSCKVDTKGVMNEKQFFKNKNDFSHVITKSRPFTRKSDIKADMCEKRFFPKKHK